MAEGVAVESVADPSGEFSGEATSPGSEVHDEQAQEGEGAVYHDLGEYPSGSPIFEQMSSKEALKKRLEFLTTALAKPEEGPAKLPKESDETKPQGLKKELMAVENSPEGYAELGMTNTVNDILELPKLHPNRLFTSGLIYQPQVCVGTNDINFLV